jgi:hypothetical protein
MSKGENVKRRRRKCQKVKMSKGGDVQRRKCPKVEMSKGRNIKRQKYQKAKMSKGKNVKPVPVRNVHILV